MRSGSCQRKLLRWLDLLVAAVSTGALRTTSLMVCLPCGLRNFNWGLYFWSNCSYNHQYGERPNQVKRILE